jgi:hypothetical protein
LVSCISSLSIHEQSFEHFRRGVEKTCLINI